MGQDIFLLDKAYPEWSSSFQQRMREGDAWQHPSVEGDPSLHIPHVVVCAPTRGHPWASVVEEPIDWVMVSPSVVAPIDWVMVLPTPLPLQPEVAVRCYSVDSL